jgi:5-formyltetrahydrofolate cyclo-ligase
MKEGLRQQLLIRRKEVPSGEISKKSKKIRDLLFELNEFRKAHCILFYVSYDHEVHTHDMIKEALSLKKSVVVPVSNTVKKTLLLSNLTCFDDLLPGAYGILEPKGKSIEEVSIDCVDLVIVPGVAFDVRGNRLGHGKGYYDSLLRNAAAVELVALAFEFQIVEKIPVEPHDVPVDIIVTEKRIINCNKIRFK